MALQKSFTVPNFGVTLTTAYAKIATYNGDKSHIDINVSWYASAAARLANKQPLYASTYQLAPLPPKMDKGLLDELYKYLKTLPDFIGSVDV